jgi:hypothetical protein
LLSQVLRAGEWFLQSGIQSPDGGVARYRRLDLGRNHPVSTEITGYAASAFVFLHQLTGDACYLDRARAAGQFLIDAWEVSGGSMPFELSPPQRTYFFDCGIIVRGLLAVWRSTGDMQPFGCALAIGDSMARDFRDSDGQFHPILELPSKRPVERNPLRWSQSPGCYQLKAAMAWWDLWEATGDPCYRELYLALREQSLRNAPEFLPGHPGGRKVVDRLHAYLYFLEGLLPMPSEALAQGIARVADFARQHGPQFERSDVYAQLLRIRLFAGETPECEGARLREFARPDGGFYFGRTPAGWEPYVNPVSTAFALQALALSNGDAAPDRRFLI